MMPTISATYVKQRKTPGKCDLCKDPISRDYFRLFGKAERFDPAYDVPICVTCARWRCKNDPALFDAVKSAGMEPLL